MDIINIIKCTNSHLLPQAILRAIQDKDQFWIKGNDIIYRFNPITGNVTSNIIKLENPVDRLFKYSFSKPLRLQDGTILFSHHAGFMRLDPSMSNNLNPAKVKFSSISISHPHRDNSDLPEHRPIDQKRVILNQDENNFKINFFIPDYREPGNNSYKFTLENYDDTWSQTSSSPEAIYRSVPPGEYNFKVQATGYRQSVTLESSLQIIILPPWYWAWWSKSLYFLIITSLIYWIYRYQLKRQLAIAEAHRLKELDTFKTRLYTNITHEFRTPLTVILGLADQLQELGDRKR